MTPRNDIIQQRWDGCSDSLSQQYLSGLSYVDLLNVNSYSQIINAEHVELKTMKMDYFGRQVNMSYVSCFPYRANVPITKTIHHRHENYVHSLNGIECRSDRSRISI